MRDIDVLMLAGCTLKEAEKHIERGTVVIQDFEENFNMYMKEWDIDEEEQMKYIDMIGTGNPVEDWEVVKTETKTYYIMFCS